MVQILVFQIMEILNYNKKISKSVCKICGVLKKINLIKNQINVLITFKKKRVRAQRARSARAARANWSRIAPLCVCLCFAYVDQKTVQFFFFFFFFAPQQNQFSVLFGRALRKRLDSGRGSCPRFLRPREAFETSDFEVCLNFKKMAQYHAAKALAEL